MKRKILNSTLFLAVLLNVFIGFSSWFIIAEHTTSTQIENKLNDTVSVKVHGIKESNEVSTVTKYYKPKSVSVDTTGIQQVFKSDGTPEYDAYSAGRYKSGQDGDKRPVYTFNGTRIYEHTNDKGEEQFNSISISVSEWIETTSIDDYGEVWDISKDGHRFRFACDSGNDSFASTHGQKYKIGDIKQSPKEINKEVIENENVTTTRTYYQRAVVDQVGDVVYGQNQKLFWFNYKVRFYFVKFEQIMVETIVTKGTSEILNTEKEILVNRGSKIKPIDLKIDNYNECGFFSDESETEFFDFSLPITEPKDIYVRYVKTGTDSLASKIHGKTYNLYDSFKGGTSSTSDSINVSLENGYHLKTNTMFLDTLTIETGTTLNLTYDDCKVSIGDINQNVSGTDSGIYKTSLDAYTSEKYDNTGYIGNKKSCLNLKLTGDMTVKGSLQIGAMLGYYNETIYSYIIDKYTTIDLNGHDIIVDGGKIIALGLIEDSIGSGKIIVKNGGSITATTTVTDGRGGRHVVLSVSKRQAPFSEYQFAYLRVPIWFYNGTIFKGLFGLYFSDFGIINAHIEIFGNDALFKWNSSSSDDYIKYEWKTDENLFQNLNAKKYLYYQRNCFYFHTNIIQNAKYNFGGTLEIGSQKIDFSVDFGRIDFPISTFWDFVLCSGYAMDLYCKITFYPGSSFLTEKNSRLNFKITSNVTYKEMGKIVLGMGVIIPAETRYVCGGINSYLTNIQEPSRNSYHGFYTGVYNLSDYWKRTKPSNIYIQGDLSFDTSIDTSKYEGHYFISGIVNLSNNAIKTIIENKKYIKTYDAKAELVSSFLYSGDFNGLENEYMLASSFNVSPLISNGVAYLVDEQNNINGEYVLNSGLVVDNGKAYFLKMDNDLYENGSASSNQGSKVDRIINIQEVESYDLTKKIIKTSEGYYLYYCGVYVPVVSTINDLSNVSNLNINIRKFMSNKDTKSFSLSMNKYTKNADGTYSNTRIDSECASAFSNVVINMNNSTGCWYFVEFSDFPKTGDSVYYRY